MESDGEIEVSSSKKRSRRRSSSRDRERERRREKRSSPTYREEKKSTREERRDKHRSRSRSRSVSNEREPEREKTSSRRGGHKERRRSSSRDIVEDRPVSNEREREPEREKTSSRRGGHKERRRSSSRDIVEDRPVSNEREREPEREKTSRRDHREKRRSSSREVMEDRKASTKEHKERRRSRSKSREKERKRRSTSRDREEKKKKSSKDHKRKRSSSRERKRDRKEDKRSRREERKRRSSSNEDDDTNGDDRRRSERKKSKNSEPEEPKKEVKPATEIVKPPTMGAYIPPAKLRMMQNAIEDKSSASYQRIAWEALKKSINGLINKVNVSNISVIVRELFKENLIRGRGLLCRSIMQAQAASSTYTNVFAALVSIINTKFPNIGELLLKRLILQFRRGYKRNDKTSCLAAVKFIAHLVNQQVAHEVLALEILTLLLEHPTAHSVEVAIAFLKEVGARLDDVSPRGSHAIFERLRHVLHEGDLEKRVQYMIEVMFQIRKDKYKQFPSVPEELDLVEEEDQFTHLVTLDEVVEGQDMLNVFKVDEEYLANEEKYALLRKEILDEDEEDDEEGGDEDEEDESGEEDDDEAHEKDEDGKLIIHDKTETNLLALRRTIYLTIQSSLDYEECCHKLLKLNLPEGQETELCHMILDCCAQQRTYEKFFGLLAGRFCNIHQKYVSPFETIFKDTYDTVHRLDTNKLRNVAKFFAHLLFTDSVSWTILEHVRLTEEETTSSSRIFIKILFQELSEYMGLSKLNGRLRDVTLKPFFEGLFPRDNPKDSRFSINFFTSIGLGGLTDELREHLKPKSKPDKSVQ